MPAKIVLRVASLSSAAHAVPSATTPAPPPTSPAPAPLHFARSRSASPNLFRNVGNGSPPAHFDQSCPEYDDEAYSRAFADFDTCDNISCVHGTNEPASWTISVEQFDEGSNEFYDRTFRACAACNRACKKSFMTYKIKDRHFDNTTKAPLATSKDETPALTVTTTSPPGIPVAKNVASTPSMANTAKALAESRPMTPLEVFSTISYAHRVSCDHLFTTCSVCSLGIVCCGCNKLHTAPARLKLRCAACSHFACASCITPYCCACRKPWIPSDSPTLILASRFRGGARSTKSSKKGSSSSSQSSGPGSLATAHSARNSPDPFDAVAAPQVTQSSTDEIDAFADNTIRLAALPRSETGTRAVAPSPSSNLPPEPSIPAPVFSRPGLPVVAGGTEDVPTAVPSRAPSCAASVVSAASTGDAGIADLLQPDPFEPPSEPPALSDVVGRIHKRYPLASLKVDEEDSRHFLARDNTRVDDIANETEYLLSSTTSWPSVLYFLRDVMKFEAIRGSIMEFQVVLAGLAEIWSDAADFDACEVLRNMVEAARLMPKAEKEINRLEATASRYRNERQATRAQLKTTEAELSRLRQAANDTLDSNARLLTEIDQLWATDAVTIARKRDEAQLALKDAIAHSKSAMAKQVSRYQHLFSLAEERQTRLQSLEKEAEEKDAYILKTEAEHTEIYRECEGAERLVVSLRQQLHDASSLFETTREAWQHDQEDFDEKIAAFKARISELNSRLNLLPPGEAELRSMVGMANERAGVAEEEYRKKSADLKEAQKEISALKAKLAAVESKQPSDTRPLDNIKGNTGRPTTNKTKPTQAQSDKKVRWSFEPSNDSSQPFWDHTNEYSRYIANMVAATVSALPNIPMQTAISTAIETVRAAGPAVLSHSTSKPTSSPKRPASPNPNSAPPANLAQRSRAPSPLPPKPDSVAKAQTTPTPNPAATMTFAQMAASVLNPPTAAPIHPAKAKPTWRAIETNKSLVLRPGTKERACPNCIYESLKSPALNTCLPFRAPNSLTRALKENHIVLAKWSMRGNLIIKCSKPMDDVVKECLHDAFKAAVPPSSADSIAILNKPPTTALKFMTVPRHNEDGSETDSFDLFNDLMAHELWRDVELFSQPRFLHMKPDAAGGTVIVSIVDDNQGTVGRKLMNTVVSFSGASRRCLRWVEKEVQLFCTQCQGWGHLNYNCLSNIMRCSKCSGPHDYKQHDRFCETCKAGKGKLCLPKCHNCHGPHFSSSKDCIFYLNRSSKERQVQLCDEFSQKWKEEAATLKAAANSDSGRATRSTISAKTSAAPQKGKSKTVPKRRIDDDGDYAPVGKGGKAKYTFGGMVESIASTSRIEEIPDDEKSNTSSELHLSYLDDVPLKTRFPGLRPPAPAQPDPKPREPAPKPLTITLPAASHKPLQSITDILRGLKASPKNALDLPPAPSSLPPARFGGGEVAYTSSAIQAEANAFASALANSNLLSQPSPTVPSSANPLPDTTPAADFNATNPSLDTTPEVPSLQPPTNQHD
ncbi:hypothetical protein AX14_014245 [Amanita brunnescens Koide BX004]|nr:hypothetical protein AX14_014245 [Amanita brunnescens Koide BX004]